MTERYPYVICLHDQPISSPKSARDGNHSEAQVLRVTDVETISHSSTLLKSDTNEPVSLLLANHDGIFAFRKSSLTHFRRFDRLQGEYPDAPDSPVDIPFDSSLDFVPEPKHSLLLSSHALLIGGTRLCIINVFSGKILFNLPVNTHPLPIRVAAMDGRYVVAASLNLLCVCNISTNSVNLLPLNHAPTAVALRVNPLSLPLSELANSPASTPDHVLFLGDAFGDIHLVDLKKGSFVRVWARSPATSRGDEPKLGITPSTVLHLLVDEDLLYCQRSSQFIAWDLTGIFPVVKKELSWGSRVVGPPFKTLNSFMFRVKERERDREIEKDRDREKDKEGDKDREVTEIWVWNLKSSRSEKKASKSIRRAKKEKEKKAAKRRSQIVMKRHLSSSTDSSTSGKGRGKGGGGGGGLGGGRVVGLNLTKAYRKRSSSSAASSPHKEIGSEVSYPSSSGRGSDSEFDGEGGLFPVSLSLVPKDPVLAAEFWRQQYENQAKLASKLREKLDVYQTKYYLLKTQQVHGSITARSDDSDSSSRLSSSIENSFTTTTTTTNSATTESSGGMLLPLSAYSSHFHSHPTSRHSPLSPSSSSPSTLSTLSTSPLSVKSSPHYLPDRSQRRLSISSPTSSPRSLQRREEVRELERERRSLEKYLDSMAHTGIPRRRPSTPFRRSAPSVARSHSHDHTSHSHTTACYSFPSASSHLRQASAVAHSPRHTRSSPIGSPRHLTPTNSPRSEGPHSPREIVRKKSEEKLRLRMTPPKLPSQERHGSSSPPSQEKGDRTKRKEFENKKESEKEAKRRRKDTKTLMRMEKEKEKDEKEKQKELNERKLSFSTDAISRSSSLPSSPRSTIKFFTESLSVSPYGSATTTPATTTTTPTSQSGAQTQRVNPSSPSVSMKAAGSLTSRTRHRSSPHIKSPLSSTRSPSASVSVSASPSHSVAASSTVTTPPLPASPSLSLSTPPLNRSRSRSVGLEGMRGGVGVGTILMPNSHDYSHSSSEDDAAFLEEFVPVSSVAREEVTLRKERARGDRGEDGRGGKGGGGMVSSSSSPSLPFSDMDPPTAKKQGRAASHDGPLLSSSTPNPLLVTPSFTSPRVPEHHWGILESILDHPTFIAPFSLRLPVGLKSIFRFYLDCLLMKRSREFKGLQWIRVTLTSKSGKVKGREWEKFLFRSSASGQRLHVFEANENARRRSDLDLDLCKITDAACLTVNEPMSDSRRKAWSIIPLKNTMLAANSELGREHFMNYLLLRSHDFANVKLSPEYPRVPVDSLCHSSPLLNLDDARKPSTASKYTLTQIFASIMDTHFGSPGQRKLNLSESLLSACQRNIDDGIQDLTMFDDLLNQAAVTLIAPFSYFLVQVAEV